jgi:hypothetical protein
MIVTFFLKLGTFFINYFGKLDTLINTLAYVRHFDILCINKLCQIGSRIKSRITNNNIRILPTYEKKSHSFKITKYKL